MTTDHAGDVRDSSEDTGCGWVAQTVVEGVWRFTLADTPDQAMENLLGAIYSRRVLCYPIDNPISAVRYP